MNRKFLSLALSLICPATALASGLNHVRFLVVDPISHLPVAGYVLLEQQELRGLLLTSAVHLGETVAVDPTHMAVTDFAGATVITIPLGTTVTLSQENPIKSFTIRVTATRIRPNAPPIASAGTSRTRAEIQKFVNTTQADTRQLTKGQAGVAEDSAGQQHVRGEHTSITYVVDGVPLPDTLSGHQGSVVVPSTIETLDIITGGFAPEFGGQTAAVLNVTTLPNLAKPRQELTLQGGSYDARNGDLSLIGPLGAHANYVIDLNGNRTENLEEPPQPDQQTAHNAGSSLSAFSKFRFTPNSRDALSLTLSASPDQLQVANRTGLSSKFASAGEGFGFQGLRNADGSRPDVTTDNQSAPGAQTSVIGSQQAVGQDITQRDTTEFGTLNFTHKIDAHKQLQFAVTVLHSGQDTTNHNPRVDVLNLPVDNSIEYNPNAARNVHHLQGVGSYSLDVTRHRLKFGIQVDGQNGAESYRIEPASQLALNALVALDPQLAPAGTVDPHQLDVDGNPVFTPSSAQTPTVNVSRKATYSAFFAQDTWTLGHLVANYGVRYDKFDQTQTFGNSGGSSQKLNATEWSPRLNFQYALDSLTQLRWSYNHLFNTPPIAQGALVGQAIQPEIVDQYDIGLTHKLSKIQSVSIAYYVKQINNQVDVGLLIPGSQIGLYSGVSLAKGGVHGLELSYDFSSRGGVGWDGYLNYTYSAAKPNGVDNTGANVPDFNDHDQRQTVGFGLAYTLKSGASASLTIQHGSGLASSIVPPSPYRTPRTQADLRFSTGDKLLNGHGGLSLDIQNAFDSREVINFQSGFSGTRFQQARRILLSANYRF